MVIIDYECQYTPIINKSIYI